MGATVWNERGTFHSGSWPAPVAGVTRPAGDRRLEQLVDLVVQLAAGNRGARLEPSPARDSVDAAITGFNVLADELEKVHRTLEARVSERTEQLDRARRQLEQLALYDPLTQLANRTLLADRMGQAIARAERGSRPPSALVFDLDEFKDINDGLGHDAGDQILVEVAHRLTEVVRETDTVARLGGDEFAILLPDSTEEQVLRIADRALAELKRPYTVGERTVWSAASVGVCFGTRGQPADVILRDADTAMYAAKANGRSTVEVFRPEMHHAARARLRIASELAVAIEQGQLRLLYQPILELPSRRVIGAEALVRWQHPTQGLLSPAEFIAVAEESGHIVELGHWVIGSAVATLRRWQPHLRDDDFAVHVNVSPHAFRWPGLGDYISSVLAQFQVQPRQLVLELSETGLMTGNVIGIESLVALRELGVGVAIDDFGTGYSSISYLRRLPVDIVKVDQSIIADLAEDEAQVRFVGAILRLIEAAGLVAVVEGIETPAQLDRLTGLGCSCGQGFALGRPMPAEEIVPLLQRTR